MKRTNPGFFVSTLLLLTILLMISWTTLAAQTPAGTTITNFAEATYEDANNNPLPKVISNVVTIIVKQVAGTEISPPTAAKDALKGSTIYYSAAITNTGNGNDTFNIDTSGLPGDWQVQVYQDVDGDGIYDAGTDILLTDSNGDGIIDTGDLAAGEVSNILLAVTTPADAVNGTTEDLLVTSESVYDSTVSYTSTFTTTVSIAVLDVNKVSDNYSPQPGDEVTYTITVDNSGSSPATNVLISDPIPSGTTYVSGSMLLNGSSLTDIDGDDDGDYNYTAPGTVTVSIAQVNSGESYQLSFNVIVDSDLESGTGVANVATVSFSDENGNPQEPVNSNTSQFNVDQIAGVDMVINQNLYHVNPGDTVTIPVEVINTGNGVDTYNGNADANYFSWEFYCDINANGEIDSTDVLCTDSNGDGIYDTDQVNSGSTRYLLATTTIPAGTADQTTENLGLTAISVFDSNVSDTENVTIQVHAPNLALDKTVSPTGEQEPGSVLTYTISVANNGTGIARNVFVTDAIPDHTTYVPGSIIVDGVSKTDSADGDMALFDGNKIIVNIDQLVGSGQLLIEFQVTIN